MRWTPQAHAHGLHAMSELLDGGSLDLLNAASEVVGTVTFGSPAFQMDGDGSMTANLIAGDNAKVRGPIVGFDARSSDGVTVIEDGTVGPVGSGADLEMTRTGVRPGDPIVPGTIRMEA